MPAEGGLPLPKAMSGTSIPRVGNVRCFDTGASQGMMIREEDYPPVYGPITTINTGNGPVTSKLWADVEVAPGKYMRHLVLPDTAPTVSVGELNQQHGLAFQ